MAKATEPKEKLPPDLDNDIIASSKRVEELRRGRNMGDIPLDDEYWDALRKHRATFAKHRSGLIK